MTRPRVLAVHGIKTPTDEQYGLLWASAIHSVTGIDVEVTEARWASTGTVLGDLLKLLAVPGQLRGAVGDVARQIYLFDELGVEAPSVIIAHSMGQALALEAVRALRCTIPVVTLGGPLSHPVFAQALRTAGIARAPALTPVHLWNRDDGVCASKLFGTRHPHWMAAHEVVVPGWGGYALEHPAERYLASPVATEILRGVLR